MIRLADYPQLSMLAWQRPADTLLDDAEALAIYEANWRFVDQAALTSPEAQLIDRLVKEQGAGVLLV